jgi:heme-degrading monooxygenase HmoA
VVLATVYFQASDPEGFRAAADEAYPLFQDVRGFNGMELRRGVEDRSKFLITASWDSVADHRDWQAEHGPEFLGILGPFIEGGPTIEHFA